MSGRAVFLLGVTERSGTNYLQELLQRHPACRVPGARMVEDYVLAHSEFLDDYAWLCASVWGQVWESRTGRGQIEPGRARILGHLGRGLEGLILETGGDGKGDVLVKTPSTSHLPMLRPLFGGVRVVFLARDGRDVAESMSRSFGIPAERCFQRWKRHAGILAEFLKTDPGPHYFLKYESLKNDPRQELRGLLEFLGWETGAYPWDRVEEVDILGSSEDYARGWVRSQRRELRSVGRWKEWPRRRLRRFWWVCGEEMAALGYAREEVRYGIWERGWHRLRDLRTAAVEWLGGVADGWARWWSFTRYQRRRSWRVLEIRRECRRGRPPGESLFR